MRIDAETAEWATRGGARERAAAQRGPRGVHRDRHLRAHRTGDRPDRPGLADPGRTSDGWEQLRADLLDELADDDAFTAALDELWPVLTPEALLAPLYASPERLRAAGADRALWRADGDAWTVSDVPLLDELVDLLGRDKAADAGRRDSEREAEAAYAAGRAGPA